MIKELFIWLFSQRIFRYGCIVAITYAITTSSHKAEIKRMSDDNSYLVEVMAEITKIPKYSIENKIDNIRRRAVVTLIPESEINVTTPDLESDTEKKKGTWFGRFLRKIF